MEGHIIVDFLVTCIRDISNTYCEKEEEKVRSRTGNWYFVDEKQIALPISIKKVRVMT